LWKNFDEVFWLGRHLDRKGTKKKKKKKGQRTKKKTTTTELINTTDTLAEISVEGCRKARDIGAGSP